MLLLNLTKISEENRKKSIVEKLAALDEREFLRVESDEDAEGLLEELKQKRFSELEWTISSEQGTPWIAMVSNTGGSGCCGCCGG